MEARVLRNTKIYNWTVLFLISVYLSLFCWIFFTKVDILAEMVLSLNLGFRVLFLLIYLVTVVSLYKKLKNFKLKGMGQEITSIKR